MKAKYILYFILGFALLLGLDYSSILWKGVTAPMREQVRREVFEETKSFNEGKKQDLLRYYKEYSQLEEGEEKEALRSVIIMQFADYDENKLPLPLANFLREVKY